MNISIFGTGYVGLVTGACLANLGHEILCVDIDEAKINSLKQGKVPFFEPNLNVLVKRNIERSKLIFTTDARQAVEFAEVIFNCVGTPSKEDGGADLSHVFAVAKTIAEYTNGYKVIINKSTVPPRNSTENTKGHTRKSHKPGGFRCSLKSRIPERRGSRVRFPASRQNCHRSKVRQGFQNNERGIFGPSQNLSPYGGNRLGNSRINQVC